MPTLAHLIAETLTAQSGDAAATAAGMTAAEMGLYGGIGALILVLLVKGLRSKGQPLAGERPAPPAPAVDSTPSVDVEQAARQAFRAPQVLVPGTVDPSDVAAPPLKALELPVGPAKPAPEPPKPAPEPPKTPPEPPKTAPEPPKAPPEPPKTAPEPPRPAPIRPLPVKPQPEPARPAPVRSAPLAATRPEASPPPPPPPVEAAGRTLREGLSRTHDGFVRKLGQLFSSGKVIDDQVLGEIEEVLFTADIGVKTSQTLVQQVHASLSRKELLDPVKVWVGLKQRINEMLRTDAPPVDYTKGKPFVIMVVGVNGSGKTTTVGKLANQFVGQGKRVVLAAGDTFRAAAVEQLAVWGERAGVPVIRGKERQDPSSVIFDAVKRAADEGYDVCLCDTAGRLQAKTELMEELGKVHRVIGKAVPGAPHEVWLVLDATNGQNAISQAREFAAVVQVTGIVMTKLDGTAKGGVVIGICDEMKLPIRFIGIGEKVEDLRVFDPVAFADALLSDDRAS